MKPILERLRDAAWAIQVCNIDHAHKETCDEAYCVIEELRRELAVARREIGRLKHEYEPPKQGPVNPKCEYCAGTGYYGDNGPGIKSNREYQPCDMCKAAPGGEGEKHGN